MKICEVGRVCVSMVKNGRDEKNEIYININAFFFFSYRKGPREYKQNEIR